MDIISRKEQIQLLIAADNIPEAVRRSMDYIKDFGNNKNDLMEVIVYSNNFSQLTRMERQGQIDLDDARRRRNQVLFGMLELIEQVETSFVLVNSANTAQS